MEASKKSAFLAGGIIVISGMLIESLSLPFSWVLSTLVFFPTIFYLVIGKEIHREYKRGAHISNGFYKGPKDTEGKRIYGRVFLRMLIWFLGAVVTSILITVISGI
ncbi:hypothetical protein LP316_03295 [Thalassotalea sp. LPB0316]|uniref:hypothetical protein n=1 Tax=Thalassotalea sp. LPB0316 TaxID=2769490 RepID=UPI00186879B4|nr:hypothetical protein [Thalassotalea sp. LPB0316]QOL26345.1 hypothetical protein LP316_03295 [Thalassotalea sp. LPB0316]